MNTLTRSLKKKKKELGNLEMMKKKLKKQVGIMLVEKKVFF